MAVEEQGTGTAIVAAIEGSGVPAKLRDRLKRHVLTLIFAAGGHEYVRRVVEAKGTIEGQLIVDRHLADAAGKELARDPEEIARAIDRFGYSAVRKQRNLEGVAAEAIKAAQEEVSEEAPEQPDEVDEDWMNAFTRHAEDASSERMRKLWGRVLAGEVRKKGAFSVRAMRAVSELTAEEAQNLQLAAEQAIKNDLPKHGWDGGEGLLKALSLETAGLLQRDLQRKITIDADGYGYYPGNEFSLIFKGAPGQRISISICLLSPLAAELMSLMPKPDEEATLREVADYVSREGLTGISLGQFSPDKMRFVKVTTLWPPVVYSSSTGLADDNGGLRFSPITVRPT